MTINTVKTKKQTEKKLTLQRHKVANFIYIERAP